MPLYSVQLFRVFHENWLSWKYTNVRKSGINLKDISFIDVSKSEYIDDGLNLEVCEGGHQSERRNQCGCMCIEVHYGRE